MMNLRGSLESKGGPLGSFALAVAIATAVMGFGGCASSSVQECGASGTLCPKGTHCAAAQGICISDEETCGNATEDPGEACDDGNTNDGDGCSRNCNSDETCGNDVIDTTIGEICDDGPSKKVNGVAVSGDGCSANCQSRETCGNRIRDVGEVCDDGNDIVGDGCSQSCQSLEVCGNTFKDPGEACDPPEAGSCSQDCRSTLKCNNGELDGLEECDVLGFTANTRDCRADCVVNRCGDGFTNTTGPLAIEECDDATPAGELSREVRSPESARCNANCKLARCGDTIINVQFKPDAVHGEQCDAGDGNNADDKACTASCQTNICGDTKVLAGVEACDDGAAENGPGKRCNGACVHNVCGDGDRLLVEADLNFEQCDDGPGNNGAGKRCNASCDLNVCGDGDVLTDVEQCDARGVDGPDSNLVMCDRDCTRAVCGDGYTNEAAGEDCDAGAANGTLDSECSATCKDIACGNGVLEQGEQCDDRDLNGPGGRCNDDCDLNYCGDGDPWIGVEQCDTGDGAPKQTATCDADCTTPVCGDNMHNLDAHEACDRGVLNGQTDINCSVTCRLVSCGNGFIEQGEACDDGLTAGNGDGKRCNELCQLNRCGDGDAWIGVEQCDEGRNGVPRETETCDADCTKPVCGDEVLNEAAHEFCDNGAANGNDDECSTTCHQIGCGNGRIEQGEACDDGENNDPTARCNDDCHFNSCGDGQVWDGVEQCDTPDDDGAADSTSCDRDCTEPVCGDGHINRDAGETCDNGALNGTGDCSATCNSPTCDNGLLEQREECDHGEANNADDKLCKANCTYNRCGDGATLDGVEQCDGGGTVEHPAATILCDSDCTDRVCGDGELNTAADPIAGVEAEECDAGPLNGTPGSVCSSACRLLTCGNGVREAGEACDDRNRLSCGTCNEDCTVATPANAATGVVIAVAGAQIEDRDTLRISDGTTTVTFTFFKGTPENPPINGILADTETAQDVASAIANAINSPVLPPGGSFLVRATRIPLTSIVTLRNTRLTSSGNAQIVDTVDAESFVVFGMSDGQAGNCPPATLCLVNADCASNICAGNVCAPPLPPVP